MQEILNKRQSTDGYKNGRFGNHLRQWDSPDPALMALGENALVMIRYRGKGSNGPAITCFGNNDLYNRWYALIDEGFRQQDLYVSERAPDHKLTFQGEIIEHPLSGGYALHWSTEKVPQRMALARNDGQYGSNGGIFDVGHHHGPGAKLLCKRFMDHDSYQDLLTLLDLYPEHTVEFSCFSVRLGNLRRNTIFWEVRKF
jgi:hypothetical protein